MRRTIISGLLTLGLITGCGLPVSPTDASTDEIFFRLQGRNTTIAFQLPASPDPDGLANQCALNENSFCELKVPVTVDGQVQSMMTTFYGNGGMSLASGITVPMVDLVGPHLFTGTLYTPTFTPGVYTPVTADPRVASETYTLTVSATTLNSR